MGQNILKQENCLTFFYYNYNVNIAIWISLIYLTLIKFCDESDYPICIFLLFLALENYSAAKYVAKDTFAVVRCHKNRDL